jgi:hypothetical protein
LAPFPPSRFFISALPSVFFDPKKYTYFFIIISPLLSSYLTIGILIFNQII